ncbi:MAG: VOC family protein [Acidimicrobiales bacterium]
MNWAGVNHMAMVTPDMDATVAFYHDVLGMELVATLGHGDQREPYPYRHYFFRIGDGQTVAFFEWPGVDTGAPKPAGVPGSGSKFDHVSFNLGSIAELVDLRHRLVEAGIGVSEVVDHTVIYSIYFDDPVNGASLEASVWVQDVTRVNYWGDPRPTPWAEKIAGALEFNPVRPGVGP